MTQFLLEVKFMSTDSVPRRFRFITTKSISDELNQRCKRYIFSEEVSRSNYTLVRDCIAALINDPTFFDLKYPQDGPINQIIYYAHLTKVSGFIVLDTKMKLTLDRKLKVQGEHSTSGWDPLKFLLCHVYFLIEEALKLGKSRRERKSDPDPETDSLIKDKVYWQCLVREVFVTLNALCIVVRYRSSKQEESKIVEFVTDFLSELQIAFESTEFAEDVVFPCGTTKHAIYLSFIRTTRKSCVRIRIDNLGLGKENHRLRIENDKTIGIYPKLVAEIPISALKTYAPLSLYLTRIVQFTFTQSKVSTDFDVIYNKGSKATLVPSGLCQLIDKIDETKSYKYRDLPPQTTDHCVVTNFYLGTLYRSEQLGVPANSPIYNQLLSRELLFIFNDHSTVDDLSEDEKRLLERRVGDILAIPISFETDDTKTHSIPLTVPTNASAAAHKTPRLEGKMPHNLAENVSYFKEGRMSDLEERITQLLKREHPLLMCAITGIPGSGKSSMANAYGWHVLKTHRDSFVWRLIPDPNSVNKAGDRVVYHQAYLALLENFSLQNIELSPDKKQSTNVNPGIVDLLWDKIGSYSRWVIIFDNANIDRETIEKYLPWVRDVNGSRVSVKRYSNGQIIITTRNGNFFSDTEMNLTLNKGLTPDDSISLLENVSGKKDEHADNRNAINLVNYLDKLPFAVRVVALYSNRKHLSFKECYESLLKDPMGDKIVDLDPRMPIDASDNPDQTRTLQILLKGLITEIQSQQKDLFKLLTYCALLANDDIPRELLYRLYIPKRKKKIWSFLTISKADNPFTTLMASNTIHSLLTYDEDVKGCYIHRVTQGVLLDLMDTDQKSKDETTSALMEVLLDMYSYDSYTQERIKATKRVMSHLLSVVEKSTETRLKKHKADILLTMGQISQRCGQYTLAIEYLSRALKLVMSRSPRCRKSSKPTLLSIYQWSGYSKWWLRNYEAATKDYDEALKYCEPGSFEMARIYNFICLNMQTDLRQSTATGMEKSVQALAICDSLKNKDSHRPIRMEMAYSEYRIANCISQMIMEQEVENKDFEASCRDGAENHYIRTLEIWEAEIKPANSWVYKARCEKAKLGLGPYDIRFDPVGGVDISKAIKLHQEFLDIENRDHGQVTVNAATAHGHLAQLWFCSEDLDHLESGLREIDIAINLWRLVFGMKHDDLIYCYYWKGKILEGQGVPQEATKLYRECITIKFDSIIGKLGINRSMERLKFLEPRISHSIE
jgi:tetratricopeptide (TPR) repeat protein